VFIVNCALIYGLLAVLGLICLNVVLGVAVALVQGTFSWRKLPQFLEADILPYGLSLAALVGAAQINMSFLAANTGTVTRDTLTVIAWAAMGSYAARMLQEIAQKVRTLFGIDVPTSAR